MNRVADVLLEPLFVALVLIALSYALSKRAPRLAFALPGVALVLLAGFATPRVANSLLHDLEQPVVTTMMPGVTYDAVIILGGGLNAELSRETGKPAFNDAAERLLAGFDLLRTNRARNGILCGAKNGEGADVESEARVMAEQLEAWGIDPSRLALDERSATTHENAENAARIARERGWARDLLVTSAAHMARARGCFLHEGLAVDALSVDFRSEDPRRSPLPWIPRAEALAASTAAIRERIGRFVYRARGWTD